MTQSSKEEIVDLLTQILRVLALQVSADRSVTDGVRALKTAGLDNQTIADVLNTSPAVVRTLASNLFGGRGKGKKKRRR